MTSPSKADDMKERVDTDDGWHIELNVKPIPDRRHDYDFWHDDYDGETPGLAGTASSISDALTQIAEIEGRE